MASRAPKGAQAPMAGPTDVVIAGTRPFALALFAPVTECAGTRPRIAPEPSIALTLCADSSGVLVVEYEPRWLPALTLLRQKRPGLRVVAALPPGQEGAALSLGPLQIDAVPWDGQAQSVLPAIERAIGSSNAAGVTSPGAAVQPQSPLAAAPAAGPAVRAIPPPGGSVPESPEPAAEPLLDLFHDLGATAATPLPATQAAVSAPARGGLATWPATGPSAAEAEALLRGSAAGAVELSSLRAVTEQTVAGLSPLEREVFTGGTLAVDAELVRHAAVLRLRVAAALATLPPPRTAIDGEAVAGLLSEIDGVLGAVKGLLADAPPEARVSLEAIRNALVKEAVDFSEACHQLGAPELLGSAAPARTAASRAASAARFLSVKPGEDQREVAERKRSRLAWVLLALVVLGAGAFHGYRWWKVEQAVAQMKTLPGQPDRMMLLPAPPGATTRELVPMGGVPDRVQVERFKAQQKLLGNIVTETSMGGLVIKPEAAPPAGEKRSKP
jgi:hypothetical protein